LTSGKSTRFNRVSVLSTISPSFLLSCTLIKLIVIIVCEVTRGTNRSWFHLPFLEGDVSNYFLPYYTYI
jgi:hypothetical protein